MVAGVVAKLFAYHFFWLVFFFDVSAAGRHRLSGPTSDYTRSEDGEK